nr:hypothetical protein [uncultured Campylobacter sp.]
MRFNGDIKFHTDKEFYEFCIAKFRCALQNSVPPKILQRCETPVQPNLAAVIKFKAQNFIAGAAHIKFQRRRGILSSKFHRVNLRSRILKF